VVRMICNSERLTQVNIFQTGFFLHFSQRTILYFFFLIKLSFRQIPFSAPEYHEDLILIIPHQTAGSLYHREFFLKGLRQFFEVWMKQDARMDLRLLHLMDHRLCGVGIQFINVDRVVVLQVMLKLFINGIAKEQGLVVKKDFCKHQDAMLNKGMEYKCATQGTPKIIPQPGT